MLIAEFPLYVTSCTCTLSYSTCVFYDVDLRFYRNLKGYAPMSEQPKLNRTTDEMSEVSITLNMIQWVLSSSLILLYFILESIHVVLS